MIKRLFESLVSIIIFNFFQKKAGEHQKRLLEKLFKNYEPLERPVEDDNQS